MAAEDTALDIFNGLPDNENQLVWEFMRREGMNVDEIGVGMAQCMAHLSSLSNEQLIETGEYLRAQRKDAES